MKTIIIHEGQKNTIQGECKPREAMEILGLNPKEWKVTAKNMTDKAATYMIEPAPSLAVVPVFAPANPVDAPPEPENSLALTDLVKGSQLVGTGDEPVPTIPTSEINVYREEFEAALQVVCDIVAKKALMPVLGMVKIVCDGETLTLSATDLELSYTASIAASFSDATAFLVDAGILYKEVKALNHGVEDVVVTVNADSIKINGRCTLPASLTDEFPEITPVAGLKVVTSNLKSALSQVLPAVSADEARFNLTGVFFDLSAGYLIATDGFRLHRAAVDKTDMSSFTVPRRAAALMHKYGADTLIVGEKQVSAILAGGTFTTRIIEGTFPDYRTVWPDDSGYNKVCFNAAEFLELIPGVLPVSEGSVIDMTINGRLDIEAKNASGFYKWHVPADSTLNGPSKTIRLNCRFLVDAIRAYADSETIEIRFPEGYGAIVINKHALIMPIKY